MRKRVIIFIAVFFLMITFFGGAPIVKADEASATECLNTQNCTSNDVCSVGKVCTNIGYGYKCCGNPSVNGSSCSTSNDCASGNCLSISYGLCTCSETGKSGTKCGEVTPTPTNPTPTSEEPMPTPAATAVSLCDGKKAGDVCGGNGSAVLKCIGNVKGVLECVSADRGAATTPETAAKAVSADCSSYVVYSSQCDNGESGGTQTGCSDQDFYGDILSGQCACQYSSSSCGSMSAYLSAMASECKQKTPSGIVCDTISENGIYGREAAKFANWKMNSSDTPTPTTPAAPITPAATSSCGASTSVGGSTTFANPLCYNTLSEVLVAVLVNLQSFLALIAIIIIIIGGMMYMFSAGSEKMIERAKSTIGGALIGLAIILAAPSFLKQIKLVLSGNITGTNADQIVSQAYDFKDIAISVINFLLSIIGILGIIALVIGGVMYVTAYGNEDRVESGKKIITNALIGILIAFGALILVKQVAALLGAG